MQIVNKLVTSRTSRVLISCKRASSTPGVGCTVRLAVATSYNWPAQLCSATNFSRRQNKAYEKHKIDKNRGSTWIWKEILFYTNSIGTQVWVATCFCPMSFGSWASLAVLQTISGLLVCMVDSLQWTQPLLKISSKKCKKPFVFCSQRYCVLRKSYKITFVRADSAGANHLAKLLA